MAKIEEMLKARRETAKQQQGIITEEIIDIPEDIDKARLVDIAKNLRVIEQKPVVAEPSVNPINIDSLVDVVEDIPEDEPYEDETYETEEEENLEEDIEEIPEIPEFPIEESLTEDPKKSETFTTPAGTIRGLVVSVTTVPFTPAKQPTNGERPIPMTRYQVLIDIARPLQLGREYDIIL